MKGMIAIAVVMFFAFSLTGVAMAQEKTYPLNYSITGEVTYVDLLSRTLTVKPSESLPYTIGANSEFTFTMDEMTNVRMCDQDKTVKDITIGEKVTVMYHKEAGTLYADAVEIPTQLVACLLE